MLKMYVSVSYLIALIPVIAGHVFVTKFRVTTWDYTTVRQDVDSSIVIAIFTSPSKISCGSKCSRLPKLSCLSLYYVSATGSCYCNSALDTQDENENSDIIHYASLQNLYQTCKRVYSYRNKDPKVEILINNRVRDAVVDTVDEMDLHIVVWPYKKDCLELYYIGHEKDGVYSISGWNGDVTLAYCDMTNGGWTVIQRRQDGSVDFYQNWMDYRMGFGDVFVEYWLGLDNIHHLTKDGSELEVYVEAFPGVSPAFGSAHYTEFRVGDIASKYKLSVTGYNGTCKDDLSRNNGHSFSTYDNDITNRCASVYHGAWWYEACFDLHLNGKYYKQGTYSFKNTWAQGIQMFSCWYFKSSQMTSKMKIRRNT